MSGRILLIDTDAARRGALRDMLTGAYFDVIEAGSDSGQDAGSFDLLILHLDAGGGDAVARLSLFPAPVMTLGKSPAAESLARGAQDHLPCPLTPALFLARVRSLIRARIMSAELALRQRTARDLGLEPPETAEEGPARVLLVAPEGPAADHLATRLESLTGAEISLAPTGFAAMRSVERQQHDAVIVADTPADFADGPGLAETEDAIGIIGALRARTGARDAAIIHLSGSTSNAANTWRSLAAFEAGATDSAPLSPDAAELGARLRLRLQTKKRDDFLCAWLDDASRLAALDTLTGLHNRRYFDLHFSRLFTRAKETNGALAAMIFDLDRFKSVNDDWGHNVGDEALRIFARRLRQCVRGADLTARIGGEEFAVILQNTGPAEAIAAAERVRAAISATPVTHAGATEINLTVSVGVATISDQDQEAAEFLSRADTALREAKKTGRDRVKLNAA